MALNYAAIGWRVLPLNGKVPLTAHGVNDATNDPATVNAWWQQWPGANVGFAIPDDMAVVDIDPRSGGEDTWAELQAHGVPKTLTAISGRGDNGRHIYLKTIPGHRLPGKLGPGVDVKQSGGYVVAPGSIHPDTGRPYTWDMSSTPAIATAPQWLLAKACERANTVTLPTIRGEDPRLTKAAQIWDFKAERAISDVEQEAIDRAVEAVEPVAVDGQKYHVLVRAGSVLGRRGWSVESIEAFAHAFITRYGGKDRAHGVRGCLAGMSYPSGYHELCQLAGPLGEYLGRALDSLPNPWGEELGRIKQAAASSDTVQRLLASVNGQTTAQVTDAEFEEYNEPTPEHAPANDTTPPVNDRLARAIKHHLVKEALAELKTLLPECIATELAEGSSPHSARVAELAEVVGPIAYKDIETEVIDSVAPMGTAEDNFGIVLEDPTLDEDPPVQLVDGLDIVDGMTTLITGLPSVGKTPFALLTVLAIANGAQCLGRASVKRPVIYLNFEKPAALRGKWKRVAAGLGVDPASINLARSEGCPLNSGDYVSRVTRLCQLEQQRHGVPPVIVIDTVSTSMAAGLDHNSPEYADALRGFILAVRRVSNSAVVALTHCRKSVQMTQAPTINDIEGTGQLGGLADAVIGISKASDRDTHIRITSIRSIVTTHEPFDFEWRGEAGAPLLAIGGGPERTVRDIVDAATNQKPTKKESARERVTRYAANIPGFFEGKPPNTVATLRELKAYCCADDSDEVQDAAKKLEKTQVLESARRRGDVVPCWRRINGPDRKGFGDRSPIASDPMGAAPPPFPVGAPQGNAPRAYVSSEAALTGAPQPAPPQQTPPEFKPEAIAKTIVTQIAAREASADDPNAQPSTFTSRDVDREAGRALTLAERISVGKELRKLGWTSDRKRDGDDRYQLYSRLTESDSSNDESEQEEPI